METKPRLIPVFVRAAFHDCITATKDKSDSGCNGSLRPKERGNHQNDEILDGLDLLDDVLPGTCLICGWHPAWNDNSNGSRLERFFSQAQYPHRNSGLWFSRYTQWAPAEKSKLHWAKGTVRREGFTSKELVASIVGGHSLGRFFGGQEEERNFTTTPFVFNIDYSTNLVQRSDSGKNLVGFHIIPADKNLLDSPQAASLIMLFAGQTGILPNSSNYDAEKGLSRLKDLRGIPREELISHRYRLEAVGQVVDALSRSVRQLLWWMKLCT